MSELDFSIIIPTYNSDIYIKECLTSIYDIDYDRGEFEVIVVDGGSSDDTLDIVSDFKKVRLIHSSNISISNSRNVGVAKSRGKYLLFID